MKMLLHAMLRMMIAVSRQLRKRARHRPTIVPPTLPTRNSREGALMSPTLLNIRTFVLAAVLAMAGSTPATHAQTAFLPQSEIDAIVLRFQAAYADTFDRRDAKAMAAMLTEDATLQNEWGDVVRGRANIEAILTRLMANLPAGERLADTPLASHAVATDVIVSQGTSQRITANAAPAQMFFTRVLVRQGGQWRLAATQIARPSAVPKPAGQPK